MESIPSITKDITNITVEATSLTDGLSRIKPSLRGYLHAYAFFFTLLWLFIFIASCIFYKFDLPILIYLLSQLLVFGVSSFYHIPNWDPSTKNFLRTCDHMSIFCLISGTQTAVILSVIPKDKLREALSFIKLSWSISIIGILRLLFIRKLYDIFDLICYIVHGCVLLPFVKLIMSFTILEMVCTAMGAIFYIVGGLIYGMEKPNLFPNSFGFHELFHLCTICANAFFGIIVSKRYVFNIYDSLINDKS